MSYLSPIGCRIVNWVTTVDGCVHTTDTTQLDSTRQDKFSTCSVSKLSSAVVGSRRELVANSIHTADADATPTLLNSTVESRRRRRCVLGITLLCCCCCCCCENFGKFLRFTSTAFHFLFSDDSEYLPKLYEAKY